MSTTDIDVAFVLSLPYPESPGGGERWIADAAAALSPRARVSVHYLVPFGLQGPPPGGAEVRVHRCVVPPGRHGERFALAPSVTRVLSADVIHVHQYGSVPAQIMGWLGRLAGASTFVTDHGSGGLELGSKLRLAGAFDGYLPVSRFAASSCPADRSRVVYGGFNDKLFEPGRKSERPEVLYVGRLMPHKGVDWLIRSLPEGARLVIAGRPAGPRASEYMRMLRSMSADLDVEFVLDAPDERIAELYRRAWVLVLPSVEEDVFGDRRRLPELLGLTPIEAMASATPIVVSDATALPELVEDGDVGAVVRQHDRAGMERELEKLLTDRSRMEKLGARAREVAEERYSWSAVADRCLAAYRELGRGRRAIGGPP